MNETKYGTLVETLKKEILSGKYGPQNPIPSMRALMRRFKYSDSTVQRALDALTAKGLVSRKQGRGTFVCSCGNSRKVGLIMPGIAYSTFFGPIVSEINRLARENEYALHFGEVYSRDAARRLDEVRDLAADFIRMRVGGVIYQPLVETPGADELNRRIINAFARAKIPVVALDGDIVTPVGEMMCDSVGIDDMFTGMRLADHLIDQGARCIHFLRHPFSEICDPADENRLHGVMAAVLRRGLTFSLRKNVLRAAPNDVMSLKRHLRRERPDAFVCSNDSAAAIFRQTLAAAGVRVPTDMMLAGFGDLPIASLMSPPLTTVRQNTAEMAREAFRLLFSRISDPKRNLIKISVASPLVVRASTEGYRRLARKSLKR